MATERVRTIRSAGGDYDSRSNWEAGEEANCVTADEVRVGEPNNFNDTTNCNVAGSWTVDATRYPMIRVQAADRHSGVYTTSKARIVVSGTSCYTIRIDRFRIYGDQLQTTGTSSTRAGVYFISVGATNGFVFDKCIIKLVATSTAEAYGFYQDSCNPSGKLSSSLIMDCLNGSVTSYGLLNAGTGAWHIHNCSFVNCFRAVRNGGAGGTVSMKNVIGQGTDTGNVFFGTMTVSNCATNDGSADDNGGSGNRVNQTFTFVNEAGDDYHLSTSDTGAYHQGADVSGDANLPVTEDIDGGIIATTFDIGCDWVAPAGGGAVVGIGLLQSKGLNRLRLAA